MTDPPFTRPLPIDPRDNSGDDKHLSCPAGAGVYEITFAPSHESAEGIAASALRLLDEKVAADPDFAEGVGPLGERTGWREVQPWQLPHSARPIVNQFIRQWRRKAGRPPVVIQVWRLAADEWPEAKSA